MTDKDNRPTVTIEGCDISNNRGHGIRSEGGAVIAVKDTRIADNAKGGVSVSGAADAPRKRHWYERPVGIVVLAVIAMGIAYFLGFA